MKSKKQIVAFTGPIGSGKTTAANILATSHKYVRISFADPLRSLVRYVTPDNTIDKVRDRELLQFIGTNYYRQLDVDYWVVKLVDEIRNHDVFEKFVIDDLRFHSFNGCLGSDNELRAVKALGGKIINICAPQDLCKRNIVNRDGKTKGTTQHESEQLMNPLSSDIDANVYNYGDFDEFYRNLHGTFKELKL